MSIAIDNHPDASGHGHSVDARDIGVSLLPSGAEAHRVGLGGNPRVANVDIEVACGKIAASENPHSYIVITSGIVSECRGAHRGIPEAGGGEIERLVTVRRVADRGGRLLQRLVAVCCIAAPGVVL